MSLADALSFLVAQMMYANQARNPAIMVTPDSNGLFLLYHALRHAVASLGAVKLLGRGDVATEILPLHVACEFCSADIVNFLLKLDGGCFILVQCNYLSTLLAVVTMSVSSSISLKGIWYAHLREQ